jgi:hypothetical protein
MAVSIIDTGAADSRWLRAAAVLIRASLGLFGAALRSPGRPLSISRTTGRVTSR